MNPRKNTTKSDRLRVAFAITLVLLIPAGSALALFGGGFSGIIFDPSNFAQNVHQVAGLVQQIDRAIRQIELQEQMLAHLPASVVDALTISGNTLSNRLSGGITSINTEIGAVGSELESHYPIVFPTLKPAWLDAIHPYWLERGREQIAHELDVSAHVRDQMSSTSVSIKTLIESSNGVGAKRDERPGVTAVAQAHVELLAVCCGEADKLIALRGARMERSSQARALLQSIGAYQAARRETLMLDWKASHASDSIVRFPFHPSMTFSGAKQ